MSDSGTPDAVQKTITVACDVETAFRIWTDQINLWWPKGHSRSGDPETEVVLEPHTGGRLFERTPDGQEYEWGQVTAWDPPRHLAYDWYLGSGPQEPTRVDVYFVAQAGGATRIDVQHRGPELIGALWSRNEAIYATSWNVVLAAYTAFVTVTHSP